MKLFHFDPTIGKRGEFIAEVAPCRAYANLEQKSAVTPEFAGQTWDVATCAENADGEQYLIYDFPVCFCIGKLTCGNDTTWCWTVLLPAARLARTDAAITDYYLSTPRAQRAKRRKTYE